MQSFGKAFRVMAAAGLAVGALTGAAAGQQEREIRGSFDQPMSVSVQPGASAGARSNSVTTIITNDNGKEVKVTLRGDEIEAELNGKAVPKERVRREGNRVVITDESGAEAASVNVPGRARGGAVKLSPLDGSARLQELLRYRGQNSEAAAPPPVMLGISMSEPDESLLRHLGLEGQEVIQVDTVRDGLPAAAAGLQPADLIVEINGKKPANQESLREILRGAKPGEVLALKVIRKGQHQDVNVTLAAYDAEKLGQQEINVEGFPMQWGREGENNWGPFGEGEPPAWLEEAKKEIESALESIKNNPDLNIEKLKADASSALEHALKALGESREVFAREYQSWLSRPRALALPPSTPTPPVVIGPGRGQVFEIPAGRAGGVSGLVQQRVDEMNARLDEMNARLDALMQKLEEKPER